jgi:Glycosyltransferase family 92
MDAYLSICAIYRDEAPYLREWVEFHRLVGVERFYLYNHGSVDEHREVLAPYVDEGAVVVQDWPVFPGQIQAYEDCLKRRRDESRWIAFIDLDEFLFSPTGSPVPDLLTEFEPWPGLGVNWVMFGSSGHRTKPPGLVIENYLWRTDSPQLNSIIKSIVNPRRVTAFGTPHYFMYRHGVTVDASQRAMIKPPLWRTESPSLERIRINHYMVKSEEEFRAKLERGHADGAPPKPKDKIDRWVRRYNDVEDRTILRYLPELRQRLERVGAAT